MTKILPGVIAMAIVVVASNILVQFLILDGLLTWGAFTYPLAFLVTDIMNRIYGVAAARRVVFVGVIVGIICDGGGSGDLGARRRAIPERWAAGSAVGIAGRGRLGRQNRHRNHRIGAIPPDCWALPAAHNIGAESF